MPMQPAKHLKNRTSRSTMKNKVEHNFQKPQVPSNTKQAIPDTDISRDLIQQRIETETARQLSDLKNKAAAFDLEMFVDSSGQCHLRQDSSLLFDGSIEDIGHYLKQREHAVMDYRLSVEDSEFKNLFPPLTDEEYRQLELNIKRDGCQDAIKIWNGWIIDGHNRYRICKQHDIPYKVEELKFADRKS